MLPVILCGGSGTRLWPLSRKMFPKQFLPLTSELAMLQETVARLDGVETSDPRVICNEDHRFLVAEQMRQMGLNAKILLEPVGRNTAPAIALSALELKACGQGDEVMLVLAADHVIENVPAFHRAIATALPQAEAGKLVTFGIVPTEPATGYGYIKGASNDNADENLGEWRDKLKQYIPEEAKEYFIEKIQIAFPEAKFNGLSGDINRSTFTLVNVCLPIDAQKAMMLLFHLDIKGIACSKGSACQSGSAKGSHVLTEVLSDEDLTKPSLRFSFSKYNTTADLDYTIGVLKEFSES